MPRSSLPTLKHTNIQIKKANKQMKNLKGNFIEGIFALFSFIWTFFASFVCIFWFLFLCFLLGIFLCMCFLFFFFLSSFFGCFFKRE